MINTDVLIVGGGPAGTACGISLRKAGVDCMIADRAKFPRMKLCAGVTTGKSRRVLAELLGTEKAKALLDETQRSHESHLRLWHLGKCFVDCDFTDKRQIPHAYRNEDWRFVLVDRPSFDNWLLQYYKFPDGKALEGDAVKSIDFDGRKAILASGETINYNKLVACDGAHSHVEQLLKRHDSSFKPKEPNALAFEINVDRADLDIDGINVCFGYVPQTYAWAFAKGEKICLGTCRLNGNQFSGKEAMENFCNELGLRHLEKYPLKGAMIPFDNAMPVPLWHDEVFFCGDAAGLDEAVTGEGIFYALRSGVDAAKAIIGGNPKGYLESNAYLQALMLKAAKYQRALASPSFYKLFKAFAHLDNRFVGYFYLTQIDHTSLDHLHTIYWNYLRDLRFG